MNVDINEWIHKDEIIFHFKGPISYTVLTHISLVIKERAKVGIFDPSIEKKLFSIFVEMVQNIISYSDERFQKKDNEYAFGEVLISKKSGCLHISCKNKVTTDKKNRLIEHIEKIKSMSREELFAYYKQQRKQGPDKESKGAGLGLIDIAKKASEPMEYQFTPLDENTFSFFLSASI